MKVTDWLGNDELAINIWEKKYKFKDESFDNWLDRVSGGDEELRQLIIDKKFLFGGRTLSNRGTNNSGSYSNCYSRGFVEDSLEDILKVNSDIALTFKAQGGQGVSLSKIRPKGTPIKGQFQSDGIIPFMEIFNTTTSSISQGGSRKGALMMSLDIWHKEASEFITIKSQEGKIEKANLSLEIDDEFMQYVEEYYKSGKELTKHIVREYEGNKVEYDVIPIKLYKLMMETVYDWGEPGCLFVTPFRNYNMMEYCDNYMIETCNPCGEQPLSKNSACNLGSINLLPFVLNPFSENAEFNYGAFDTVVHIAIRNLDKIVDENLPNHALPEQREQSYKFRNVGLGIMGLGSALIAMRIKYGSVQAIAFCKSLMKRMFKESVKQSIDLARTLGSFPEYSDKLWDSTIIKNNLSPELIEAGRKYGIRNCSLLSIAPTGSLATMLNQITGGCEPEFAFSYTRLTKSLNGGEDRSYKVYSPIVKMYEKYGGDPENLPDYFISSADINWLDRIKMQAALQYACDTAISSTINLPENTPKEDIELLYLEAWKHKLKGVTIFRDGCKRLGILTTKESNQSVLESNCIPVIKKVTNNCIGLKRTLVSGCGTLHLTAFWDPETGQLLETYFSKGSAGGCLNFMNGLSRMVSLAARANVGIEHIVDQLKSAGTCPSYAVRRATKKDTSIGSSCPVAIGNALLDMHKEMQEMLKEGKKPIKNLNSNIIEETTSSGLKCPECGMPVAMVEGCITCPTCGYSKCS